MRTIPRRIVLLVVASTFLLVAALVSPAAAAAGARSGTHGTKHAPGGRTATARDRTSSRSRHHTHTARALDDPADVHPAKALNADGRPELFAVTSTGALEHNWWTGAIWSGWHTLAAGPFAGSPAVLRNRSGTLEVFAVTSAGAVVHLWQRAPDGVGGWTAPVPLGTASGLVPEPTALVWPDGHAEVFAVSATGTVDDTSRAADGDWSAWGSLGGSAAGALAVAVGPNGNPVLFTVTVAGELSHQWWTGSAWSGWSPVAAGAVVGTPAALVYHNGIIGVFVRTAGGGIDHVYQLGPDGAGGWSSLEPIGTAGAIAGDPAAVLWPDGHGEVFAVTSSGAVVHAFQEASGAWSGWLDIGGSASGRLAVWMWPPTPATPQGHPEAAAYFTSGTIEHSWWLGHGWAPWGAIGPPAITFSPPGLSWDMGGVETEVVTNTGAAPLRISSVQLTDVPPPNVFTLAADHCFGKVLSVGAQCSVSVNYNPELNEDYSAKLIFSDNAPGSPQIVYLSGIADCCCIPWLRAPHPTS